MNLVTPDLSTAPGARVVVNSLYDSKDPGFLTQDLMLVELPGGTYIDVSWFPEHDPSGSFVITVFRNRKQVLDSEVRTAHEAMGIVEALASEFVAQLGIVSCSYSHSNIGMSYLSPVGVAPRPGIASCSTGRIFQFHPAA